MTNPKPPARLTLRRARQVLPSHAPGATGAEPPERVFRAFLRTLERLDPLASASPNRPSGRGRR